MEAPPLYTREQLSAVQTISQEEENFKRFMTGHFISEVGGKLFRKVTTVTAQYYFQSYYADNPFPSPQHPKLTKHTRMNMAYACLLLAGKAEEQPVRLEKIILTCAKARGDMLGQNDERLARDSDEYNKIELEVLKAEMELLDSLGFELIWRPPHAALKQALPHFEHLPFFSKRAVLILAIEFLNDSLCTALCLHLSSDTLAKVCTMLAALHKHRGQIRPFLSDVGLRMNIKPDEFQLCITTLLALYKQISPGKDPEKQAQREETVRVLRAALSEKLVLHPASPEAAAVVAKRKSAALEDAFGKASAGLSPLASPGGAAAFGGAGGGMMPTGSGNAFAAMARSNSSNSSASTSGSGSGTAMQTKSTTSGSSALSTSSSGSKRKEGRPQPQPPASQPSAKRPRQGGSGSRPVPPPPPGAPPSKNKPGAAAGTRPPPPPPPPRKAIPPPPKGPPPTTTSGVGGGVGGGAKHDGTTRQPLIRSNSTSSNSSGGEPAKRQRVAAAVDAKGGVGGSAKPRPPPPPGPIPQHVLAQSKKATPAGAGGGGGGAARKVPPPPPPRPPSSTSAAPGSKPPPPPPPPRSKPPPPPPQQPPQQPPSEGAKKAGMGGSASGLAHPTPPQVHRVKETTVS